MRRRFRTESAGSLIMFFSVVLWIRPPLAADPPPVRHQPEEYSARRQKVLEALRRETGRPGIAFFRSPPASRFAGDVDYPYRPDNDVVYLTGIAAEGAALLLSAGDIEGLGREVLFLPPPSPGEGVWITRRMTRAEAGQRSGIRETAVLGTEKVAETLRRALPASPSHHGGQPPAARLYFDAGPRAAPGEPLPHGYSFLLASLGSGAFHLDLKSPGELTGELRQIKSPAEMVLLRKAISITCDAHRRIMRSMRPALYEYQVASEIEHEYRLQGAAGWAFPSIVGSGPNSCVLHYDRYDRQIGGGDLVLMDIGAEYGFYAADVTRTIPASGRFTDRQRQVYQIVYDAQEAAFKAIRPGLPFRDVNRAARDVVAAGLVKLGLIKEPSEVGRYLPHFTSHGLGLDVHDAILDSELKAGMVITVEPGIYIPEEALGVRIEDDVLVTETGCEVLSASAPRSPDDVEAWMRSESF